MLSWEGLFLAAPSHHALCFIADMTSEPAPSCRTSVPCWCCAVLLAELEARGDGLDVLQHHPDLAVEVAKAALQAVHGEQAPAGGSRPGGGGGKRART